MRALNMKADAEILEVARGDLSHPVSDAESWTVRRKLLLDAASGCLFILAYASYTHWVEKREAATLVTIWAVAYGSLFFRQYRAARARPATPVPGDVLAWTVRQYRRCPSCRTITKGVNTCPQCGAYVMVDAGRVLAAVLGLVVLALLWVWLSPWTR